MGICSSVEGGGGAGWGAGCGAGVGCTFFAGRLDGNCFCAAYDERAIKRAKVTRIRNPNLRRTPDIKTPIRVVIVSLFERAKSLLNCSIVALVTLSEVVRKGFGAASEAKSWLRFYMSKMGRIPSRRDLADKTLRIMA